MPYYCSRCGIEVYELAGHCKRCGLTFSQPGLKSTQPPPSDVRGVSEESVDAAPLSQDELESLAKLVDCPPFLRTFSHSPHPQLYEFSREKNGWFDFRRSEVRAVLLNCLVGGTIFTLVGIELAQRASTTRSSVPWWMMAGIGGVTLLMGIPIMFMRETLEVSKAHDILLRTTFNLFRYKREQFRLSELRFIWVHTVIGFKDVTGISGIEEVDHREVYMQMGSIWVIRNHGPIISLGQGDQIDALKFAKLMGCATGLPVRTSEHRMNQPTCPKCGMHVFYNSVTCRHCIPKHLFPFL